MSPTPAGCKVKRVDERKRPGLAAAGRAEAMDLYPLPDLVRLIGSKWPVERLEGWTPSYAEAEVLEVHAEAALRALIWIAQRYDWGQAALDDYLAQEAQDDAARPGAPQADPEAFSRRVADWAGDRTQASAAKALGISLGTYRKVIAGKAVSTKAQAQIEAKVGA